MSKVPFGFVVEQIRGNGDYALAKAFSGPCKLQTFHKKAGDRVVKGENVVFFTSRKLDAELKFPVSGTIISVDYKDGSEKVPSEWHGNGKVLAFGDFELLGPSLGYIETDEVVAEVKGEIRVVEQPVVPFAPVAHKEIRPPVVAIAPTKKEVSTAPCIIYAVPAARHVAREQGIPLGNVIGTGPDGIITVPDLSKTELPKESITVSRLESQKASARKEIARLLQKSWEEIPQPGDHMPVNVTKFCEFRDIVKVEWQRFMGMPLRYDYLIGYLALCALRLPEFKVLNAYWDKQAEKIVYLPHIHFGFAVETPIGLMTPVVRNVEELTFRDFAIRSEEIVLAAHDGEFSLTMCDDLTFTLNNPGVYGGVLPRPIIPYVVETGGTERPSSYILAMGAITGKRKKNMNLSFAFDHRAFDGKVALGFVRTLKDFIEALHRVEDFYRIFELKPF